MPFFSRLQRRSWSLHLAVVLLLHLTFGVCDALADVICFEPNGNVVLEVAGEPCPESDASKPCMDLKADSHESHDPASANAFAQADLQPLIFLPALAYLLEVPQELRLAQPVATGPPVSTSAPALRRSTVLHI